MKKITKNIILAGSLILGYYTGSNMVNDTKETTKYELITQENNTYLKSKETKEIHILRKINNETYMGTLEHLVLGVKELSQQRKINNKKGETYE